MQNVSDAITDACPFSLEVCFWCVLKSNSALLFLEHWCACPCLNTVAAAYAACCHAGSDPIEQFKTLSEYAAAFSAEL